MKHFPTHSGNEEVSKEGQQVVWKDSVPPISLRCPFSAQVKQSAHPSREEKGGVRDKGIFTLCRAFKGGEKGEEMSNTGF